jgi:hypothetical protein
VGGGGGGGGVWVVVGGGGGWWWRVVGTNIYKAREVEMKEKGRESRKEE